MISRFAVCTVGSYGKGKGFVNSLVNSPISPPCTSASCISIHLAVVLIVSTEVRGWREWEYNRLIIKIKDKELWRRKQ